MKRLSLLLAPLCAALSLGLAPDSLRRDMVALDKVYIAALALTSQGKAAESKRAVAQLEQVWQGFRQRHFDANPSDPLWHGDFEAVQRRIDEAAAVVASPRKVTDAHEALEQVRVRLMALRERNGIEYFVDHLTAFHEPMEAIVLAAKDKTQDSISADDVQRIRQRLPQALAQWQRVMAAPLDAATYQLDAAQLAKARRLMDQEQRALGELRAALDSGHRARIVTAAVAIKPSFAALFMAFGDLQPFEAR